MSRATGQSFEARAAAYLTQQGLKIVEQNYQCRSGELDLIARDGEYYVFVEVKFRQSGRFGEPFEHVGSQKQRRMTKAALHYAQARGIYERYPMRFDVVSIQPKGNEFEIQWLQNAFLTHGY